MLSNDYVKMCCSNDEKGRSLQFIHTVSDISVEEGRGGVRREEGGGGGGGG